MTRPEIEAFITEVFDQNFELLRQEYGSSLTPEAREAALNQVMLYWLRLRDVAEHITDTEVPIISRTSVHRKDATSGSKAWLILCVKTTRSSCTISRRMRRILYAIISIFTRCS